MRIMFLSMMVAIQLHNLPNGPNRKIDDFLCSSCHSRMDFTPKFDIFLEWAPILPWSTAFDFLKIHQPKIEILQFEASKASRKQTKISKSCLLQVAIFQFWAKEFSKTQKSFKGGLEPIRSPTWKNRYH